MYANNSVIDINLVGEGFEGVNITSGGALECHTDDTTCCRGIDNSNGDTVGGWFFPNRTKILPYNSSFRLFYYVTRGRMVVRLNIVRSGSSSGSSLVGTYQCKIPSANGMILTRNITLAGGGK